MYKAALISKELVGSDLVVTIEYSDGVKSFQEVKTTNGGFGSVEQLKAQVKQRLDILNKQQEMEAELAIGDVPKPTVEVVAEKTVEELALAEFQADYYKLQKVNKLVELGVLTGQETPIVALQNKVKADFKVKYLDLL